MGRYSTRHPQTGRFAPIPDDDDESVDDPSVGPERPGHPGTETDYAVPAHDYRYGPAGRLLPARRAIVVDAETGQHIADVTEHQLRALAPDLRRAAHLAAVPPGDEYAQFVMAGEHPGYDTVHNPPRDPGQPRTLPPAARIRHGVPILPDEAE